MSFLTDYHYNAAYGLRLRSNKEIPGLIPVSGTNLIDVNLRMGDLPPELDREIITEEEWHKSPFLNEDGQPYLKTWKINDGEYYRLTYLDGTTFIVDRLGTGVWATWQQPFTIEDTATYLLGPVLGFILRLKGITCLHASVISIGGQAVALIGVAGAGKSTTAAAFARMGHPVLTEDVAAIDDYGTRFFIRPGYPLIRLWSSSVEMLYGKPDALPLMTPNWDKRYLDLTQKNFSFQAEPLPLGAIYFLQPRSDDESAPLIEEAKPQEALVDLVSNAYTNYLLESEMRAKEFNLLGRIVEKMLLRKVTPHKDPARLLDLCQLIISDFERLNIC
ncbi:MAG: hypothetical protein AB7H86_20710 [Blastocatellales bacterium]